MRAGADTVSTPPDVDALLAARNCKAELRFVVCGSVDDGKSTLLGRLLRDSSNVPDDQFAVAEVESRTFGSQGRSVDLALLVDGLQAEREQGITIDVAYRCFETNRRKFVAIDSPGHEQYTCNMATGASNAELALMLVDARKGVLSQTRRHSYIVALMGIRQVVLAVNKMDLVNYEQQIFNSIADSYESLAREVGIQLLAAVPLSALTGENVVASGPCISWHDGPTLMEVLEAADEAGSKGSASAFRMPVQWVNRPHSGFRGFSGTVSSGAIERGGSVAVSPSGSRSTVGRILGPSGELDRASAGQAITLVLDDETDVSRGDMIADSNSLPELADEFTAHLIWMDANPMLLGRSYLARFASASAVARVTDLAHRIDFDSLETLAASKLELNEIGHCQISLNRRVPFDPFLQNRQTGAFVLIDRFTDATVGAGVIRSAVRRGNNVVWQDLKVEKEARSRAMGQRPCILWFTGLSGAGKSTIADRLEQRLQSRGRHTYLLDGDNVRHGLNRDLGFAKEDRVENIRRIAEVASLMVDAGLIVIVSFISPFRAEREMARGLVEEKEFVEIFVDTPLEVCEKRDPKGLYAMARRGELADFTGVDSPYEPPENAELRVDTTKTTVEEAVNQVMEFLRDSRSAE